MENLILGNFNQGMKSELRRVVKGHLISMYPSPINIPLVLMVVTHQSLCQLGI